MKINEIFYSIQGEGYWTGKPAIFIRFAGCNLNCSFCDTNHKLNYQLSAKEILKKIYNYSARHIVFTGGEATLQINYDIVKKFQEKGYYIQIETNGTKEVPQNIDWITVSPKEVEFPNSLILKQGDTLKVVYQGQDIKRYEDMDFRYFYLQPLAKDGKTNAKECIKIVKENPKWKLSIQMQKILKIK